MKQGTKHGKMTEFRKRFSKARKMIGSLPSCARVTQLTNELDEMEKEFERTANLENASESAEWERRLRLWERKVGLALNQTEPEPWEMEYLPH